MVLKASGIVIVLLNVLEVFLLLVYMSDFYKLVVDSGEIRF